jgi:hypothetical protein
MQTKQDLHDRSSGIIRDLPDLAPDGNFNRSLDYRPNWGHGLLKHPLAKE